MRSLAELKLDALECLNRAMQDFLIAGNPLREAEHVLPSPTTGSLLLAYKEVSPMLRIATSRTSIVGVGTPIAEIQKELSSVQQDLKAFEDRLHYAYRSARFGGHRSSFSEAMLRIHSAHDLVRLASLYLDQASGLLSATHT